MDYTSTEFDIQKIDSYTLLIQAGKKEHRLAVVDNDGNLLLLTTFDLNKLHSQAADILDAPFVQVCLTYPQHAFTFVPDEVYDERHVEDYASLVSDGITADQVAVSHISALAIRNVFAVEPMAYHYFTSRFPHARVIPDSSTILQVAGGKFIKKQGTYLGIDICEFRLAVYCFSKGRFLFYNTFEVTDENDFNYHLLHVVRGLALSWDTIRCVLSGCITAQDAHYKVIAKYTDQVEFADTGRLSRVALPASLAEHQHRYLTLMGLYACES